MGEADFVSSLELGKQADFLILDAPNNLHLCYHFGVNLVQAVFKRGRLAAGPAELPHRLHSIESSWERGPSATRRPPLPR